MFSRHQTVGEREICSYMLQMASLLFAPPRSRSSCILSDYYHIFVFVQLNQIDEDLGVFLHQLLFHQLLLHQDLLLVLCLVVLRDGGVAVELQLVVTVLRLAWLNCRAQDGFDAAKITTLNSGLLKICVDLFVNLNTKDRTMRF